MPREDAGPSKPRLAEPFGPVGLAFEIAGLDALPRKPLVYVSAHSGGDAPGPEEPWFVLYEDGFVLLRKSDSTDEAAIGPAAARALADRIVRDGAMTTGARYDAAWGNDMPATTLIVREGARWHMTTIEGVYGAARAATSDVLPPAVREPCRTIAELAPAGAKPWSPERIEVSLTLRQQTNGAEAAPWPSSVPAPPKDRMDRARGHFSYEADGAHEPALRSFLDGPPRRWTVALDGRTWAIAVERRVPSEDYLSRVRHCLASGASSDGGLPSVCTARDGG